MNRTHSKLFKFASSSAAARTILILRVSVTWNILQSVIKIRLHIKRMQKNGSNRHLKKQNHDKRSTCCPLKMLCPWTLLRNLTLTLEKKIIKIKNKLSCY